MSLRSGGRLMCSLPSRRAAVPVHWHCQWQRASEHCYCSDKVTCTWACIGTCQHSTCQHQAVPTAAPLSLQPHCNCTPCTTVSGVHRQEVGRSARSWLGSSEHPTKCAVDTCLGVGRAALCPIVTLACASAATAYHPGQFNSGARIEPIVAHGLAVVAPLAHAAQHAGSVVFLPSQNAWALTDFGHAARSGGMAELNFSLYHAAPEMVAAWQAGQATLPVDPAIDVWALGVRVPIENHVLLCTHMCQVLHTSARVTLNR